MAAPAQSSAQSMSERLEREVQHAVQRNFKGLDLLGAPAPAVGPTPKTLLHRRGTLSLYHYHAQADEVYRVPMLLVMAPTNKAFVFDMAPGQSLIEYLLGHGHDVYVMDWNEPSQKEKDLRIEDYTLDFIPDCVRRVQADSGIDEVSIVGYCAGGLLSAIYAALNPAGALKNLVTFTVPIDFSRMELFRYMTDPAQFDVDRMIDSVGIVPGPSVLRLFSLLRPASDLSNQIRLWDNLWNDAYVRQYRLMERWTTETLSLPGAYVRQTVKDLLQRNALYEDELEIGGRKVDLRQIRVPLLSFVAKYDHIVPPESSRPLYEKVSSTDKEEVVLPGGHVSLVAGPNAVKRMWPKLNEWLGERSI